MATVAVNAAGNDNGRNVSELNHLSTPTTEARMAINPANFTMPTPSLPGFPSLTRLDTDQEDEENEGKQAVLSLVEQLRQSQAKHDKQERDEFLADGLAAELAAFDVRRERERQEIIERSAKLAAEMRAERAASRLASIGNEIERDRPVARQVRFTPTSAAAASTSTSRPESIKQATAASTATAATPKSASAPIDVNTPARFYPNVDPAFSVARAAAAAAAGAPSLNAGVDLNALANLMQGRTLKAQAEKPQRFDGQPTIGLPTVSDKDGRRKQSLTEWLNSVDLYFALCGLTDERICFLFAMSLLEGAARTFMEAGVVKATPLTMMKPDGTSAEVQPQTWSWLKTKLRLHY
ncbi:MAG: hypothetical protein ACREBW_10395, partial [Candidatus Micrarchaeaceae archaeon]